MSTLLTYVRRVPLMISMVLLVVAAFAVTATVASASGGGVATTSGVRQEIAQASIFVANHWTATPAAWDNTNLRMVPSHADATAEPATKSVPDLVEEAPVEVAPVVAPEITEVPEAAPVIEIGTALSQVKGEAPVEQS